MSDHVTDSVVLVGAGPMAAAHAAVLTALEVPLEVVGRSEASCRRFTETTGIPSSPGGIGARSFGARRAIVAVGTEQLAAVTLTLLERGVRDILVEKPAGLTIAELEAVAEAVRLQNARVLVAYNRRYYASVRRARQIITEDGGVLSFTFEFTEWIDRVKAAPAPAEVKARWLVVNSTHVIDLAFHLGGRPVAMTPYVEGGLDWHLLGSVFAGAGYTEAGALFSYTANWEAPGRWGLEVMTRRHRLVLRPLEQLSSQRHGSTEYEPVPLDDRLDRDFKPGLFRQVEAFLSGGETDLPSVAEQLVALRNIYEPLATGRCTSTPSPGSI